MLTMSMYYIPTKSRVYLVRVYKKCQGESVLEAAHQESIMSLVYGIYYIVQLEPETRPQRLNQHIMNVIEMFI